MSAAVDQANVGEFTQDTAGSTIAITTGVNVASNGFIVLAVGWAIASSLPTLSTVTDNGPGLTWTIDRQGAPGTVGAAVAIVSAQAPSGLASGTVITATLSGSAPGARVLLGSSWTGVPASSPVDVAGSIQTITSTTAWTTGNLTVAAGSLIVGFAAGLNTDGTSTPTSPSIETHDVTGGAGSYNDTAAYRIESGAGTVAVAGTFSTAQTGAGVGVAYKAAADTPHVLPFVVDTAVGRSASW